MADGEGVPGGAAVNIKGESRGWLTCLKSSSIGKAFGGLRIEPKSRAVWGYKVDASKVTGKEAEASPTGQIVTGDLDIIEKTCFVVFVHGHPAYTNWACWK